MANNSSNSGNTAFSGFAGGHDSGKTSFIILEIKNYLLYLVPGVGDVPPATAGFASGEALGANTLGANLPHVNPNNFPGTVHWGPETVVSGPQVGQLPPA
jgi:hypothetical protein